MFRDELDASCGHRVHRKVAQGIHAHEPLIGEIGLDHGSRSIAAWNLYLVGFYAVEQPTSLKHFHHPSSRIEAVESLQFERNLIIQAGRPIKDVDLGKAVAFPDLVVIEVMGRRDLQASGAKFHAHMCIGNHRHLALDDWYTNPLANQMLEARVLWMHCNRGIPKHGLGPRGRNGDVGVWIINQGIADSPERSVFLLVLYFEVGNSGAQDRVPVHQSCAAINVARLITAHKGFLHGIGVPRVHGEALVGPVKG